MTRRILTCVLIIATIVPPAVVAQRFCRRDPGVMAPTTTFLGADACPSGSETELKLFLAGDLQSYVLTTPVQFQPSDTLLVSDSVGDTLIHIREGVGVEVGPLISVINAEGHPAQILGHFALESSLPSPCRIGSTATARDPAKRCACVDGTTWACVLNYGPLATPPFCSVDYFGATYYSTTMPATCTCVSDGGGGARWFDPFSGICT